jgi:hypothetical protein
MRITCTSVFVVTLLLGWFFFGWFGDFNLYVVYPDGSRMIKQHATLADRVIFGFIIALLFTALDTAALWLWQRFRTQRQRLESAVGGGP